MVLGVRAATWGRTSVRTAYHRYIERNFCHNWSVPTMDAPAGGRGPVGSAGGDQVDFRLHLSRRFSQAGAGIVGVARGLRVLAFLSAPGPGSVDAFLAALALGI